MTADKAQKFIALSGLALFVLGPLSMILPVFFFTPLDRVSWFRGPYGVPPNRLRNPVTEVTARLRLGQRPRSFAGEC